MKSIKQLLLDTGVKFFSQFFAAKPVPVNRASTEKILVMKHCCIGDVLMTTPFVAALHAYFPEAKIDYMVSKWAKEVLDHHPYINKIILSENYHFGELLSAKYDVVFVLDVGIKSILKGAVLKPRILAGMNVNSRGFLLNYKSERVVGDRTHERESYLDILQAMNIPVVRREMQMHLTNEEIFWAEHFVATHDLVGKCLLGVFPGGGKNPGTSMALKQWGERKYAELLNRYIDQEDMVFLLFGSSADKTVVDALKALVDPRLLGSRVIDMCGQINLRRTASLIKQCRIFITNDSGPMHMAAALGVPTVSIFGPTDPELLKPYGEQHVSVVTDQCCTPMPGDSGTATCRPCYRQIIGDFNETCQTRDCMNHLDVDTVFNHVAKLLKE